MRKRIMFFDSNGADPLGSAPLDEILKITDYKTHTITSKDAINPWLLADDEYDDVELYFVILYYNGLVHATELVEGTQIKIPLKSMVMRVFQNRRKVKTPRIAAI